MPTGNSIVETAQRYDIVEIVNRGIAYAIIFAGFLSVVFIFVGGFSFILSGGQEDKIKHAVSTIRYAIIGLVITIFAVIIVGTVGKVLGIDINKYLNFSDIVNIITNLAPGNSPGSKSLD